MKKKVRIAVAIDLEGNWASCGFGGQDRDVTDSEIMSLAIDQLGNGENQYFIEVELDIPEIKTIEPVSVSLVTNTD